MYIYDVKETFAKEYNGEIYVGSDYAEITIGETTVTFYFSGGTTSTGGEYENENGSIKMERDDFLKAMGLTYEKGNDQQFKLTQSAVNIEKSVDFVAATAISASGFISGLGGVAFVSGIGFGFYTTFVK
ncbi:hypothetical protein [Paenibacillus sp. NEAU-GSW1]|uniref:hypothetical protein n=1 Tax=Paenibacillus sp. NEAU-GSW1 TaxID=2682486 RepID=UPI0012E16BCC|nr:hypothetical protein [Paenibacillus sp. NEAU-GSW1]MUT68787.1 hypothetical protein [Paenibacillus sp. NEAU-GSW1]